MIYAIGIDWEKTSLEQREHFSLEGDATDALVQRLLKDDQIRACVPLRTCNRFELYIDASSPEAAQRLQEGLCAMTGYPSEKKPPEVFCYEGRDAALRLMEIAAGLRSQVFGEDQVISQVRDAIKKARDAGTVDPDLETLFRLAVTAGKAVRTQVKLQVVPRSSAHKAVKIAAEQLGSLRGRRALVIGNGVMGRLAAELLVEQGCSVSITLRSYTHGQTLVPSGCTTVPYGERIAFIEGCDLAVSATRSPHFTLGEEDIRALGHKPSVLIDMAVPRDIDPGCRSISEIAFYDMDDLCETREASEGLALEEATSIIDKHLADFQRWEEGRERYRATAARLAVFAGTSEGRDLCRVLAEAGRQATVFVATEYGRATMPGYTGIEVRTGRLDEDGMAEALRGYSQVVDATHPYAAVVSRNILRASDRAGCEYIRLLRPSAPQVAPAGGAGAAGADRATEAIGAAGGAESFGAAGTGEAAEAAGAARFAGADEAAGAPGAVGPAGAARAAGAPGAGMVTVRDSAAAAAYLAGTSGPVLLTTGSRDLEQYTSIPDFAARLHPRILPDAEALSKAVSLGYLPANLICMQGPFTHEMNAALLDSIKAEWIVTKDSGKVGGVIEKLSAAEQAGVGIIMIARPEEERPGMSFDDVCERLLGERPALTRKALTRFPLFIDLEDKPCLVVGAGSVGTRRCGVLRDFGAQVTLIAPDVSGTLPDSGRIRQVRRRFEPGDTEGMELVVAATNSRAVNHAIAQECKHEGIPVSVADCPEECSFYFPAVGKSSRLSAGVVSGGEDHSLVKRAAAAIRRTLEVYDA